jgi:hypothetical protein
MRKGLVVAVVKGNALVIRIPVETLAWAAEHSETLSFEGHPLKICDRAAFAKSVVRALCNEGEDGSTPVTHLFDSAFDWVLEQGEDGPDYGEDA